MNVTRTKRRPISVVRTVNVATRLANMSVRAAVGSHPARVDVTLMVSILVHYIMHSVNNFISVSVRAAVGSNPARVDVKLMVSILVHYVMHSVNNFISVSVRAAVGSNPARVDV